LIHPLTRLPGVYTEHSPSIWVFTRPTALRHAF
jgi:hypothetical protein